MEHKQEHDRDFVQSLEKGLDVLRCFDRQHHQLTSADVARLAGITPAAARRFLLTLERLGYLHRSETLFRLTSKVLTLGYTYFSGLSWVDIAMPLLEELTRSTGESSAAGIVQGQNYCALVRVPPPRIVSIQVTIGSWLPAGLTATGRAIVAYWPEPERAEFLRTLRLSPRSPHSLVDPRQVARRLEQIQVQGYEIVDQEIELGLLSAAVPVFDNARRVIGGINLSTTTIRSSVEQLRTDIIPRLKSLSREITTTSIV